MYQQNMDQVPTSPIPPPPGNIHPPGNGHPQDGGRPESNFKGLSDVDKRKKEDNNIVKNGVLELILRACAMLFSFLSFIIVAVLPNFHVDKTFSYVFSIALITMVYSAIQLGIKGDEFRTKKLVIPRHIALWIAFIGDQVLAYLLMSSASVASLVTSAFAPGESETVDKAAASIAMLFLAFFCVAPSAAISSYHLFIGLPSSINSSVRPTDGNF